MKNLANEIINGRRINSADDLDSLVHADLDELCRGADMIRRSLCGDHADLCTIVNGRSGRCCEDCKFCAQSAHHCTDIAEYPFLSEEGLLRECLYNAEKGVHGFAVVTAGRALSGAEFDLALKAFRKMREQSDIRLCASFGFLTSEQFRQLKEAGVIRIHCNIETSRRNFPNICTTHTFDDKIACIKRAQNAGLEVCSGGIIGMGETWADRIDMALTLADLGINSVPINALTPITGTPFADIKPLSEDEIIRTAAIFRYILPTAYVRLAAGRELIEKSGERAFLSGVNSAITGDMLTTSGSNIDADKAMLSSIGFQLSTN